jgi:hypothetical protein
VPYLNLAVLAAVVLDLPIRAFPKRRIAVATLANSP